MKDNIKIDVVTGLCWGDEAKAKVVNSLCKNTKYTHVLRYGGGSNCGHTIYNNGKKFVTHLIPVGVFHNIKSVIGPCCVLNVKKFFNELEMLETNGINTKNLVKIAYNTHIVTEEHIDEEENETKIGTTKQGIGPAYIAKYGRKGIRAESIPELKEYLIDMQEEFYDGKLKYICGEGHQAMWLDIDWGDYPYVTSSHCGIGSVLLNGFNHKHINKIFGVAKAYDTYVGAKEFEPKNDPIFQKIREIGGEFGATTGRPRQCNWLNLDKLEKATYMNGANIIVINKIDILRELKVWKLIHKSNIVTFETETEFRDYITNSLSECADRVMFSDNPNEI